MNIKSVSAQTFCVATLLLLGGTNMHLNAGEEPKAVMGNEAFNFTTHQLKELEDKGLHGDGDAALKVAIYYSMIRLDFAEDQKWERIAANNGNAIAQYNLYFFLKDDPSTYKEAIHWLKKAASQGDEVAVKKLAEIQSSEG